MKQYNIYSGLGGSFGGASYQYTGLYETEDEALDDAFESACSDYEQYAGSHRLFSWKDAIDAYCADNGIDREDFVETDENSEEIEEYYNEERESWLEYNAVLTEKDGIDQEDLIIGYVIEDDSTSQTDSE